MCDVGGRHFEIIRFRDENLQQSFRLQLEWSTINLIGSELGAGMNLGGECVVCYVFSFLLQINY